MQSLLHQFIQQHKPIEIFLECHILYLLVFRKNWLTRKNKYLIFLYAQRFKILYPPGHGSGVACFPRFSCPILFSWIWLVDITIHRQTQLLLRPTFVYKWTLFDSKFSFEAFDLDFNNNMGKHLLWNNFKINLLLYVSSFLFAGIISSRHHVCDFELTYYRVCICIIKIHVFDCWFIVIPDVLPLDF